MKSCSKISTPSNFAAAITASFSDKFPEIDTVAIAVFIRLSHVFKGGVCINLISSKEAFPAGKLRVE
jgi:hypothetical protein